MEVDHSGVPLLPLVSQVESLHQDSVAGNHQDRGERAISAGSDRSDPCPTVITQSWRVSLAGKWADPQCHPGLLVLTEPPRGSVQAQAQWNDPQADSQADPQCLQACSRQDSVVDAQDWFHRNSVVDAQPCSPVDPVDPQACSLVVDPLDTQRVIPWVVEWG